MTQVCLTFSAGHAWSLAAQAVQIPLQLRDSPGGMIGEAARACLGPESATSTVTAFGISLIHPVPLRLTEALLKLGPARLTALHQQILVHPIDVRIVLHNRTIEAGALVNRRS